MNQQIVECTATEMRALSINNSAAEVPSTWEDQSQTETDTTASGSTEYECNMSMHRATICGIKFSRDHATAHCEYLKVIRGTIAKSLALINDHRMAEIDFSQSTVLADDQPDSSELAALDARYIVAMRHISLSERWNRGNNLDLGYCPRNPRFANVLNQRVFFSLWYQLYMRMGPAFKSSRNGFAHELYGLGGQWRNEMEQFGSLQRQYTALLPVLTALIQKFEAALDDTEAWRPKPFSWGQTEDEDVSKLPEYAKDTPETEAVWAKRDEVKNAKRHERDYWAAKARQAWAEKHPDTEGYDSEAVFVFHAWRRGLLGRFPEPLGKAPRRREESEEEDEAESEEEDEAESEEEDKAESEEETDEEEAASARIAALGAEALAENNYQYYVGCEDTSLAADWVFTDGYWKRATISEPTASSNDDHPSE